MDEPEPEVNQSIPVEQNDGPPVTNSVGDKESGIELDSSSIAMIAVLLLFNVGVVAWILAVRRKSKRAGNHRQQAMNAFERDLFADSGPVASPSEFKPATPPPAAQQPVEAIAPAPVAEQQPTPSAVPDLPSIEDLLG